jgi:hypothetical protein
MTEGTICPVEAGADENESERKRMIGTNGQQNQPQTPRRGVGHSDPDARFAVGTGTSARVQVCRTPAR